MTEQVQTVTEFINKQLDKQYNSTAGRMLAQIRAMSMSPTSQMQMALRELDDEMQQADKEHRPVTIEDPVVRKTLNNYKDVLLATQILLLANAAGIEDTGGNVAPAAVTAKVFLAITTQIITEGGDPTLALARYQSILSKQGIQWNVPTTMSVERFVDSAEWIARMEKWGEGYATLTRNTLLNGIQSGWGPSKIAEALRQHAQNIPMSAAENLTRTLQVTAYRESCLAMEKVNGRFILRKIRIATLDQRTCLSCISLHGSELAAGQRVDDHYRGRCSEYYVVPGGAPTPSVMQVDSPSGGRRFVPWQSGEEWFASLPRERQLAQASFAASPGKYNAYLAGNPLSAFVTEHQDNVFGNQVLENSIVGAFGEEQAQQYYVKSNR